MTQRFQPEGRIENCLFANYGAVLTQSVATVAAELAVLLCAQAETTVFDKPLTNRLVTDYIRAYATGGNTTTSAFQLRIGYVNALSTSGISIKSIYTGNAGIGFTATLDSEILRWPTSVPNDSTKSIFGGTSIYSTTAFSTGSAVTKLGGTTQTLTAGDLISLITASGSAMNINYNLTVGFRGE